MSEPKLDVKGLYQKEIQHKLLDDSDAKVQLMKAFKKHGSNVVQQPPRLMPNAVCRLAATRVLSKALVFRKQCVGSLLKTIRMINSIEIRSREDFGEGIHAAHSEPYN